MVLTLLAEEAAKAPNGIIAMAPLLLMGGAMYFFMIRPQQKRQRAQRELLQDLVVGDDVLTIGGIYGTIRGIDAETDDIILEVGPGLTMRIIRSAIARQVGDEEDTTDFIDKQADDDLEEADDDE